MHYLFTMYTHENDELFNDLDRDMTLFLPASLIDRIEV